MATKPKDLDLGKGYRYGWHDESTSVNVPERGLSEKVVRDISAGKDEPEWMTKRRVRALAHFRARPMPNWGADLSEIDFENIYYYVKPLDEAAKSFEDLPEDIKRTYVKLGISEAEQQRLIGGVTFQYESESVYHSVRSDLQEKGVLFTDMDTALKDYPEMVKEYFGTVIPSNDNKFAALNTAVWSGGSFIYVPPGVQVEIPLQAYFRINKENMGQFERTLIIVDEGAYVHYVEGCSAPIYATDSLHSAVVEIIVKKNARCRYTTIQNWSNNVYNLVTKRAVAYENAVMEWVDGNIGCLAQGSRVTTRAGVKPIEEITPGEEILSFDEPSGELVWRTVLGKKFSGYQPVREVRAGNHHLLATNNHPFLAPRHEVDAFGEREGLAYMRTDILSGSVLTVRDDAALPAPHDGSVLTRSKTAVEIRKVAVSEPGEPVPTWDIEVEGTGNFVSEGFIVHNSKITMKYPSIYLMGEGARGEVLSVAFAGEGQHQDAGGKIVHHASNTSGQIISKSVSAYGGRTGYRGLIKVEENAENAKDFVRCDALILDTASRSDTYPYMEIGNDSADIGHEATVSKIGEDQLFYLMSRGISENEAMGMIVNGFIEPITKELPMEYAVELTRLIQLQMEGAVG